MVSELNLSRAHVAAYYLVIAAVFVPMFSPPLSSLVEVLLVLVILSSLELRNRVIGVWQQPLGKSALILYVVISVGTLYSIAPLHASMSAWVSWRKLLLLPITLAIFDNHVWKKRLLVLFISLITVLSVISFISWSFNYPLSVKTYLPPGIFLRNHVIQGMMFSTGAFSAVILAIQNKTLTMRVLLISGAVVLVANAILITTGRSGYLALLIYSLVLVSYYLYSKQWPLFKMVLLSVFTIIAVIMMLLASPTSRGRILLGIDEIINYKHQVAFGTSMGLRVLFWKNSVSLIANRPLFGHGTGGFGTAYSELVAGRPGAEGVTVHEPHNQYLKMMVEHGVIGLIAFLAILMAAIKQRPAGPQFYRLLGLGAMFAWAATSLVNSHFSYFTEGTFIYLWLGAMLSEATSLSHQCLQCADYKEVHQT